MLPGYQVTAHSDDVKEVTLHSYPTETSFNVTRLPGYQVNAHSDDVKEVTLSSHLREASFSVRCKVTLNSECLNNRQYYIIRSHLYIYLDKYIY